jgi:RhtB (resistance to homoserine/threonine) family protein
MQEFLSISALILLGAISPGPDFAMVTRNSLMYSRQAGIYTALGISTSILIHACYCILGLAIIISKSLLAFTIMKYLGASYLIYIGIKSLFAKRDTKMIHVDHASHTIKRSKVFYQGLLCNLLNPSVIMFFLAFFTMVVKPGYALITEAGYALEIAAIQMLWFSSLVFMLTHPYVKSNLNRIQFYIVKMMGVLLVGFGFKIATLSTALL